MKTMKTRNKRRIDHFVPESYLKGFTNCESKFYVWEKLESSDDINFFALINENILNHVTI